MQSINKLGRFSEYDWWKIATSYDDEGRKSQVITEYLDRSVRTDTFKDGKLVSKTTQDIGDVEKWAEQRVFYDETGGIARRETLDDKGIETVKSYEGRTLRELTRTDTEDVAKWTETLNTYDSFGDLLRSQITYDNQDAQVYLAESRAKLEYDGDGSDSWLFRVTTRDPEAGKLVKTYDTFEEAPALVQDAFGFLF